MEMIYDILSWTALWLCQPVTAIGPYNAVTIVIGHIFLGYFMLTSMLWLWLMYKYKGEV